MFEISADATHFLDLDFRLHFFLIGMPFGFVLELVVLVVEGEVMVAGDDHFVLVGQALDEVDESIDFTAVAVLSEVAGVDEDVSGG